MRYEDETDQRYYRRRDRLAIGATMVLVVSGVSIEASYDYGKLNGALTGPIVEKAHDTGHATGVLAHRISEWVVNRTPDN